MDGIRRIDWVERWMYGWDSTRWVNGREWKGMNGIRLIGLMAWHGMDEVDRL